MKNNFFITVILLSFQIIFSQEKGTVKGNVFLDGEAISGANIYIKGNNSIGTTTDVDGAYTLGKIPLEQEQVLIFNYIGAISVKKKVTVSSANPLILDIKLTSNSQLEEVVVSGTLKPVTRMESPVPVEVYTPTFFKKNPTPSIFEALQNVNGVRPQLNCGLCNTGDIHINGLEGPYTLVLIDGMPIVSGLSTVYGLSGIPNSLIERVEIVKGPASSLYGSEAVGGLVNIITQKPNNAPKFSIDGFATSWGEFNLDVGTKFKIGKAQSILGINYFNYNQRIDSNNDNYTDLTLQDRISVFNKWNFSRKSGKEFSIAGRIFYEDRWGGEQQWTKKFRGGEEIYGESIYTKRGEVFGVYALPTTENLSLSFSATTHNQNSFYGNQSYNAQQHIAFTQLTWNKVLIKHDLLFGLAGRYNFYDDNTPATRTLRENNPENIYIPSIFMQDQIELAEKNDLLLGVRYDYDDRHGSIITPRIAYKYAITPKDVARLNFGTGFRVVNLFTEDHAALTGSREVIIEEDLDPEESINVNVNYLMKRYLSSGTFFNFEASAWYTYFSNRINPDFESNPNEIRYSNSKGHAVSQGISIQADVNFNFGLKALLGTSLLEVSNVEDGEKIRQPLTESFNANWSLSYKIKPWSLVIDYTGNLYGPMRLPTQEFTRENGVFVDDPRAKNSPYWSTQNIQFTYDGFSRLEIYGGVKNLLDWTPARNNPFVISGGDDPFQKDQNNPNRLPFDTTYVYTSLQGIRGFLGIRYNLF